MTEHRSHVPYMTLAWLAGAWIAAIASAAVLGLGAWPLALAIAAACLSVAPVQAALIDFNARRKPSKRKQEATQKHGYGLRSIRKGENSP